MTLDLIFGLSPLLIVAVGALLLMLVEALSKLRDSEPPSASLAAASAVVLFAALFASIGVWMYGPDRLPVLGSLAPYLPTSRWLSTRA